MIRTENVIQIGLRMAHFEGTVLDYTGKKNLRPIRFKVTKIIKFKLSLSG